MERSSFDVIAELFAKDIDTALLAKSRAKTFAERLAWVEEMRSIAAAARRAKTSGAP